MWQRHLCRTAFVAVQVSNLLIKLEIASGEEQERPRNDIYLEKQTPDQHRSQGHCDIIDILIMQRLYQ